MKKIISIILSIIAMTSTTAFAAEIPRESTPMNVTEEQIRIVENLICDILVDVRNGRDLEDARKAAYVKIYQSINPNFNYDEQFSLDTCYRDIPVVDAAMFTVARKLIIKTSRKI